MPAEKVDAADRKIFKEKKNLCLNIKNPDGKSVLGYECNIER